MQELLLSLRMKIYNDSITLARSGLSSYKIAEILSSKYKIKVSRSTIYRWIKNHNKPDGAFNNFTFKKSKELSYVIGVLLGDGQIKIEPKQYHYRLRLRVKDREFAEEFARCLQIILEKKTPCKIYTEKDRTRGNRTRFVGEASSKILVRFLKRPWITLVQFAKPYTTDFLRGLFDSEGFTNISTTKQFPVGIGMANTNLLLLRVVQSILKDDFQIKSHINLSVKKGTKVKIWNLPYEARKDLYTLNIHKFNHVKKFQKEIGFTILRKKNKLHDAIVLKDKDLENVSDVWKANYAKIGREWVRIGNSGDWI